MRQRRLLDAHLPRHFGRLRVDLNKFIETIEAQGLSPTSICSRSPHSHHRDPFDRLLVAQSLSEPLILLTTDAKLAKYGATVRVLG